MSANAARFASDMGKARQSAKSLSSQLKQSFNDAQKEINKAIDRLMTWKGVLGVVGGAAGIGLLVKKSLEAADSIAKAADATGLSTTALQEYRYAANLAGIGTEAFDGALKTFAKNLGAARAGGGSLLEALKKIDPALASNVQHARSTEQAFQMVLGAMDGMKSQADRAALSAAAFGKAAGVDMTLMLKDGVAGIAAARQQAQALGIVMDESMIRQAEQAKDQFEILATVLQTSLVVAVSRAMPEIQALSRILLDTATGMAQLISDTRRFDPVIGGTLAEQIARTEGQLKRLNGELADLKEKQAAVSSSALQKAVFGNALGMAQAATASAFYSHQIGVLTEKEKVLEAHSAELRKQREALGAANDRVAASTKAGADADLIAAEAAARRAEQEKLWNQELMQAQQVITANMTAEEKLAAEIERLQGLKWALAAVTGSEAEANLQVEAAVLRAEQAYKKAGAQAAEAARRASVMGQVAERTMQGISQGFADAIVEGKSFDKIILELTKDIAKMVIQLTIFNALKAGFGGIGLFAGTGAALSGGRRITKYGRGGVTNGPVTFPMRGGLGQAGERFGRHEGIFPLTRIGADLGVKAELPPDMGARVYEINLSGMDFGSQTAARRFGRMLVDIIRDNTAEGKSISRATSVRGTQNDRRAFS